MLFTRYKQQKKQGEIKMKTNEHNEHCKNIVDTMLKYYNGDMYHYNGEDICISDFETMENDNGEYITIENSIVYLEDLEPLSLWDFFNDIYNINYIVDDKKEFVAVRIMIACGGPNIYINTLDKQVELFWWTESGKAYIPYELNDEINAIWEEYYNCL